MLNILIKRNAFKLCGWLMAPVLAFSAIFPSDCCCAYIEAPDSVECSCCAHISVGKIIQSRSFDKLEIFSSDESSSKTPCSCQCYLEIQLLLLEDKAPARNIIFHSHFISKSLDEVELILPFYSSGTISECSFASSLEQCISLSCFTL